MIMSKMLEEEGERGQPCLTCSFGECVAGAANNADRATSRGLDAERRSGCTPCLEGVPEGRVVDSVKRLGRVM
jgi:hypothetical protein